MRDREKLLRARFQLKARLGSKENRTILFRALMGDGTGGDPRVPTRPNYVYVRQIGRGVVSEVLNMRVAVRNDLPVLVGFDPAMPDLLQILTIDNTSMSALSSFAYLVPHHKSHELGNVDGGDDTVWVQGQQFMPLLGVPQTPNSMFVDVYSGLYPWGTGWHWFDETTSPDFTASVPGVAGQARYTLLSIDGATETLQLTDGDIFPAALPPPDFEDMIPGAPLGSVPIAAVVLLNTTTAIGWSDILDARMFAGPTGGSVAPGPHQLLETTVHDDTDTQAPTEGSLIVGVTGATVPLWTELVRGTGDQFFQMDPIGTLPAWSSFDWDRAAAAAAADMVHDHSAAAEGDAVPVASLGNWGPGRIIYGAVGGFWTMLVIGNIGDVMTVNAAGTLPEWAALNTIGRWEPLTDGDPINPELLFMGGDVIMMWIP